MPSDPDYVTRQTDRRMCGSARVPLSGEGSSSVPSPVKEIKFEKKGRTQEQSSLCAAHVMAIGYRPALRYPFSGEGSNSIPSPVKRIQAHNNPSTLPMMMRMSGKSLLSTLPIVNKQRMSMRLLMTLTDTQKSLCMRAARYCSQTTLVNRRTCISGA